MYVCYFLYLGFKEDIAVLPQESVMDDINFHYPSECRMMIPGTYAEMMQDYG